MSDATTLPAAKQGQARSAQTNAVGANVQALAADPCDMLDIVNLSGTDIEYQRNGAGVTIKVPHATSRLVLGISDASQIAIRRVDLSNTQATVTYEIFTVR